MTVVDTHRPAVPVGSAGTPANSLPREQQERGPGRRPPPSSLAGWFRPLVRPLAWYAASRLLILVVGAVAILVHSQLSIGDFFAMWDGDWYLRIAREGYPHTVPDGVGLHVRTELAFFPLFPLMIRAVTWATPIPEVWAGTLISLLFGAVSVVLMSYLARTLTDKQTADRAVALFCFFPGSLVLSVAYSEGVMIALALACTLALLRRRWLAAGLAAGLATAARPNAVALVAACAWQSLTAIRQRREWRSVVAPLLAPAGMLAFFAFLWHHTGVLDAWFQVERRGWNQRFDFGLHAVDVLGDFLNDPFDGLARFIVVTCLAFLIVSMVILVRRRLPGALNVYTVVIAALATLSTIDIVRVRAILTAFPLFIALAMVTTRPRAFRLLLCGLTVGTTLITLFPFWGSP